MILLIWLLALLAAIISYRKDRARTLSSLRKSIESLRHLSSGVFGLVAGVGLALAVVPEKTLVTIFTIPDTSGIVLVSMLGAIVNIPGPIAFPLAGEFLKIGVRPSVLASFITTLTMVGMVSAPLEVAAFGIRFTFWRQLLSFLAAIAVGLIMGVLI